MRKQKIYLESTMFNYYFDEDRDAHIATVRLFNSIAEKYDAYTSVYVIAELQKASPEKYSKMVALIEQFNIQVFALDREAEQLADVYVEQGIIPLRYRLDGIHIAVAAVHDLDIIVSMNFEHIVKLKTKIMTEHVNALKGYRAVAICTPQEVSDYENS